VGISHTLQLATRNGIMEISLIVIFNRGATYIPRAVITLGIGPHSSFEMLVVLVAISNGIQAVILCSNKIFQFLAGGAG